MAMNGRPKGRIAISSCFASLASRFYGFRGPLKSIGQPTFPVKLNHQEALAAKVEDKSFPLNNIHSEKKNHLGSVRRGASKIATGLDAMQYILSVEVQVQVLQRWEAQTI